MSTWYVDPVNGSNSNNGSSFALRCLTLQHLSSLAAGDSVRFIKSPDATNIGVNATWTNLSATVALASAVTQDVTTCETAWTASTNVTSTTGTGFNQFRQGSKSAKNSPNSSFTTGLAAFFAISSTDFSSKQQLCFWFYTTRALAANVIKLSLCSDNAGATPVNDFTINFATVANAWYPITIDFGSALSATVQSIALYVLINQSAGWDMYIDNIFCCTAPSSPDSINLNSLISKNTGTETWYAIQSIVGANIILDNSVAQQISGSTMGYYGTTATVATYKREVLLPPVTTGDAQQVPASGSSGNVISITGGWDTTNMSTQTGVTWYSGRNCTGFGFDTSSQDYIFVDKIGVIRYQYGWVITGGHLTGNIEGANCNDQYGVYVSTSKATENFGDIKGNTNNYSTNFNLITGGGFYCTNMYNANSCAGTAIFVGGGALECPGTINVSNNPNSYGIQLSNGGWCYLGTVTSSYNDYGLYANHYRVSTIKNLTTTHNAQYGIYFPGFCDLKILNSFTSNNNTSGDIQMAQTFENRIRLNNANMTSSTVIQGLSGVSQSQAQVYSQNEGGTHGNNVIYFSGGKVTVDSSTPHTGGGIDWKIAITDTHRHYGNFYRFPVPTVAVQSGSACTLSLWIKLSSSNIFARFIAPGGQIAGVSSDVIATCAGAGYNQYSLTFTPGENGVIQAFVDVWTITSTTDSVQVADFGAS